MGSTEAECSRGTFKTWNLKRETWTLTNDELVPGTKQGARHFRWALTQHTSNRRLRKPAPPSGWEDEGGDGGGRAASPMEGPSWPGSVAGAPGRERPWRTPGSLCSLPAASTPTASRTHKPHRRADKGTSQRRAWLWAWGRGMKPHGAERLPSVRETLQSTYLRAVATGTWKF